MEGRFRVPPHSEETDTNPMRRQGHRRPSSVQDYNRNSAERDGHFPQAVDYSQLFLFLHALSISELLKRIERKMSCDMNIIGNLSMNVHK